MFRPKKRFGQNFLCDRSALERIVEELDVQGKNVIEIGPGKGALTEYLIGTTRHLNLIEIDRDLTGDLEKRFPQASLYQADALTFDYNIFEAPFILVGNLPYNISTPLLFKFIEVISKIEKLGVMLQKEVADRLVALPGTKAYGRLSVMFQLKFTSEIIFELPAAAFYPKPLVTSSFLIAKPNQISGVKDELFLGEMVSKAFNGRRKMLKNSLSDYQEWLEDKGERRPETLSLLEWVTLSNKICDLLTK